jgi:hypothetical protein
VRDGLRRLVRRIGPPPAAGTPGSDPAADGAGERARWRNLLLDEVGSDARPLVDLLLRVQGHGLLGAIPAAPLGAAAWAPLRARLAFGYAAETFLDADVARWAVDAWGYAIGAVDADGLYVAPPVAPFWAPAPVAPPAVVRTPVVPAAVVAAPAVAAGATHPAGRAKLPGRVRRAMARANAPPTVNPFPANFDRIAGFTCAGIVAVAAFGMWIGIVDRREAGGLEVAAGPGAGAPAPAVVTPTRADAARGLGAAGAPGARRAPGDDGALRVDSLRLRDGTVRTGLVERLTSDGLVVRDPTSDSTARFDLDEVVEWRTRRGEVVPVGDRPAEPEETAAAAGATPSGAVLSGAVLSDAALAGAVAPGAGDLGHAARVAGLAGRYAVRRRVLDVSGSESCGAVAAAVRASAPTVETVEHRPGEAEFALTSRPGLRGTVDDDGRFRTGVVNGEHGGIQYRFRMVGQFLPDGFRAETESETRTVLRWRDVQRCRVSVALHADRLP